MLKKSKRKRTTIMLLITATFCLCCQKNENESKTTSERGLMCTEQQTTELSNDTAIEKSFAKHIDYTGEEVFARVSGNWQGTIQLDAATESEDFTLKIEPYQEEGKNSYRFYTPTDTNSTDDNGWSVCAANGIDVAVVAELSFGNAELGFGNENVTPWGYLNTHGAQLYKGAAFPEDPYAKGVPILGFVESNSDEEGNTRLMVAFMPNNQLYFARTDSSGEVTKWTKANVE